MRVNATNSQSVVPQSTEQQEVYAAEQTSFFIGSLLKKYRPRLSIQAYSPQQGLIGNIDFYDNFELVETYSIRELHAFGVSVVKKPYGADLIYAGKSFVVSSWNLPAQPALDNEKQPTDDVLALKVDEKPEGKDFAN